MVFLIFPLQFSTITIFALLLAFVISFDNKSYENCSSLVSCGDVQNIGYPFWGLGRAKTCGHPNLRLQCPSNRSGDYPIITIKLQDLGIHQIFGGDEVSYNVLRIHKTFQNISIQLRELHPNGTCPIRFINSTIEKIQLFDFDPSSIISLSSDCNDQNGKDSFDSVTCLQCESKPIQTASSKFPSCYGSNVTYYYLSDSQKKSTGTFPSEIKVPVIAEQLDAYHNRHRTLVNVLKQGFEVQYDKKLVADCCWCEHSDGICGSFGLSFICLSKPGPPNSGYSRTLKLIIGLVIPGALFTLIAVNVGICYWMKLRLRSPILFSGAISEDPTFSDVEIGRSFFGVPVFSYSELQEATNNFCSTGELGDGGFGTVYYGKLRDGREVAVKRLYERNFKRMEQFLNEIEVLTRLHHPNLVTLYGCTSRHSRELLLVYEYIPNGTVADHLYRDQSKFGTLTWSIRMKIAVQTATALSYLHASGIIHRDVKTNNILLDNNFLVKLADFGLSRFFPLDATHVSTMPQGTPGYVDPEYHRCYQVTNRSDVYSFGVVLIELISSLPAFDVCRHEDEINLSDYAMNRIQNGDLDALVDQKLGFESDFKVKRMTTLVAELAFQCLQQEKEIRLSMREVFQTLKQIESLDYEALESEEKAKSLGTGRPT